MDGKLKEYADFLEQYVQLLSEQLLQEKDKREALLDNDPKRIEAVLQAQQAALMKLKNFEQKRIEMQDKLGFSGMSAEEMLKALESRGCEELGRLRTLFKKLRDTANEIKEFNKISTDYAKKQLKFIELLTQQDGGDGSDGIYGSQGSKEFKSGHTLEKTI